MKKQKSHHEHSKHNGPGHSRSLVRLKTAMLGESMILNSFLIEYLLPDQIFASELSSMIGTLILITPIFITTAKDLMVGQVHMNELVALSILASMTEGKLAVARLAQDTNIEPANLLQIAGSIENVSNHPIAKTLRTLAVETGIKLDKISNANENMQELFKN